MDIIQQVFNNLNSELIIKINDAATTKFLGKGTYFLKEGQVNKHMAVVNSGILQSYFYKDGKEITTYLAGPGKIVVSLSSYLNQMPSKEYIKALVDTELILIHKTDIDKLIDQDETFRLYYIKTLEYQITCIDESRFDFITLSAEERYIKLLSDEPYILQQVPLKYIAATLGITERQLTRIRKKIIKRKI